MSTQLTTAGFSDYLNKLKPQMALALPKHLTVDRMARLAMTAFSTNKELQKCDAQSIAASIMVAVQLGLEPNVNGAGYLIPYNGTCTFVPGWKGLADLVSRSGRGTVYTGVIYEDQIQGQHWEYIDGSRRELTIKHQSSLFDEKQISHAYAIGWVEGSQLPIIELWNVAKIKAHRDKFNKLKDKHYSYKHWEMYARKVVLLQVLKYMPSSIELSQALDITNATEFGGTANIIDGVVVQSEQPVKIDYRKNLIDALDLISNCASYEEVQAIDLDQLGIADKDMKIVVKAWQEKAGSFANSIVDDADVDFDEAI